jgi:phosphatidylglycerol:prolipoprotein diacylglycerol transferase
VPHATQLGFHERLARFGLALILACVRQLIDRALSGHVVDFVDVYWGNTHFWAFNVADAAITVGPSWCCSTIGLGRQHASSSFEIGGFLSTCDLLLAAGYCSGCSLRSSRPGPRSRSNRLMDLGIWIIISALVGAKFLLLIVEGQIRLEHRRRDEPARSGGVFYGGLIAAVVVALWYLRRHRMPMWTTTDVFAPGIALGHVIGRMGCLFAGCCFGRPTDLPWAITFHDRYAAENVGTPLNIPLHPTQLYEAGAELLILGFLLLLERRGRAFPGRTFWSYMLFYGVSRFIIEFYRGDSRGMIGALSTSQFVSVLIVPLSLIMLFILSRRPEPTTTAGARKARAA